MKLHKGSVGIGLIVFGLLFGANTHQEFPAGEAIIRMFGGPARSHGVFITPLLPVFFSLLPDSCLLRSITEKRRGSALSCSCL